MQHCETTALGVLLRHEGLDLSEPMLFGLGSGLSFLYWDTKAIGFPFLGGRVKPFELTRTLAARLGLRLGVHETGSRARAWRNVAGPLDAGWPVGLQLDCFHLEYFTSPVHFGGHIVALCGYDGRNAHLVDTDQQGGAVTTSLTSLADARAARGPMTARNRSFVLEVPPDAPAPRGQIVPAIVECAVSFLDPPIENLGHRGIEKAAGLVPTWLRRSTDPERDLTTAADLMERGGTGGALFRNLYRDFLDECTATVDDPLLRSGHASYAEAARGWTEVARLISEAGATGAQGRLDEAGTLLHEVARLERAAMQALSRITP